jgi:hypothetical protein
MAPVLLIIFQQASLIRLMIRITVACLLHQTTCKTYKHLNLNTVPDVRLTSFSIVQLANIANRG